MRWVLISLIRSYQLLLSPLLGPACRFDPSCSEYGRAAIERHGVVVGVRLSVGRLLRCQPFARGGYDPVPPPDSAATGGRQSASPEGSRHGNG